MENDPEPRWPAVIAVLAVGALNLALPDWVSLGPRGLLLGLIAAISLVAHITHVTGYIRLNHTVGFLICTLLTAVMLGSLIFLLTGLSEHKLAPPDLLKAAGSLWVTNVLVFSLWYWRLDAGGPNQRDSRVGHPDGAFLFPQMTMSDDLRKETEMETWTPGFVDYLFVAFNASTALSPTDSPILTRWAKLLTMAQSMISLLIIVLLVARAINTLQ